MKIKDLNMRHLSTVVVGRLGIISLATLLVAQLSTAAAGEISIRNGDSIAFLGDSNTQAGWEHPYGYVRLVLLALEQEGAKATPIPAGVAGDTSERMLKRLDGVLAKKPTWLTLSCGFNDVSPACAWQVGFEDFTKNVTAILDKSQAAGVKVINLTPTLYQDTVPDNATNQKASPYVEFLRQTAKERNLPLADLNAATDQLPKHAYVAEAKPLNDICRKTVRSQKKEPQKLGSLLVHVLMRLGVTTEPPTINSTSLEAPVAESSEGDR
jgi:lysophospholipase L1-like esterase